jgi:hypothetical protein
MNIHLAGSEAFNFHHTVDYSFHNNYLTTFAHFANGLDLDDKVKKAYEGHKKLNHVVILDSGAFSKATGKIKFELSTYITFLKKYNSFFDIYMNLDEVILDEFPSSERIKKSIVYSTNSLNQLEKEGLTPIPVYQKKWNNFDILEEYMNKYSYISIGGLVTGKPNSSHLLLPFLDEVFELNEKYKVRIHGLGVTSDICLKRYPFYSTDSTSWIQGGKSNTCYFNVMDKYISLSIESNTFSEHLIDPHLFDDGKTRYANRLNENIRFFNQYERILTEVWMERGVQWEDYDKSKHFTI